MTPQEFVERQIITTRYFNSESETLVSMAGVAFKTGEDRGTATLFNPNDENISLLISANTTDEYRMVTYHCFAGLFASRIYRCLDKTWEIYRLHLNIYKDGGQPAGDYGELLHEEDKGGHIARIYVEHLGPPVVPKDVLVKAIEAEKIESLIERCPIKLTPDPRLYAINLEAPPHPGVILASDEIMAPYITLPKTAKREYIV